MRVLVIVLRRNRFGTVTGRVGAAVDHALIYVKGGWAWEDGQHSTKHNGRQL